MSPLYVYALLDGPLRARGLRGLARERVATVRAGSIHAAFGVLEERPAVSRGALEGHDRVVRALAKRPRAVLPVRFGSTVASEAALRDVLSTRERELARALARVRGREQMTLRVFGEPRKPEKARSHVREPALARGAGARYLERRRREHARSRSIPELDPLRERLSPLIVDERLERHEVGALLGTAHHMVERGRARAYRAAVSRGQSLLATGLRVRVSGPSPPYAFAPEALA
ncbi:GvpL/GvpF family gas vesicle protein [bacterium]|nr:GvpL/GvpF family gas vesicle protein [bacterium]